MAHERRWADLAHEAERLPAPAVEAAPELAYLLGDALRRIGRAAEADAYAVQAEVGAARIGDRRLTLRTINLSGMIAFDTGRLADASDAFSRLLDRATEWSDDEFAARAANNLGILANVRGERQLAITCYQHAIAAYQRLGYLRGIAQSSYNLGISCRDLGLADDAERHYDQAIRFGELAASEDVIALAETERAWLRALNGDGALAERIAARALKRHQSMEDPGGAANATRVLARAAEARGESALALTRLDEALTLARSCGDPLLGAEVERDQGRMLHALGRTEEAREALGRAIETFTRLGALADADEASALLARLFPGSSVR